MAGDEVRCPECETLLDEDGYCTDPGCRNVGKIPDTPKPPEPYSNDGALRFGAPD